jgi:hypothetical protein
MGWWISPPDSANQVGDGALDAAHDFLQRFTALYQDELGRKPTVEELEAVLSLVLRGWADPSTVQNFDEREVTSVAVKTAKRKKRLPYQLGDVFAIPLSEGRYAFGRIYNLDPNWNLVEIFAHVGTGPYYSPEIAKSGRLIPPITVSPREVFENGLWKIVYSDPAFVPADIDSLRYATGLPGMYKLVKVNQLKPLGPLTDEEATKYPLHNFKPLPGTLADIERALKKRKL